MLSEKEEVTIALAVAVTGLSIYLSFVCRKIKNPVKDKFPPARGPDSSDVLKRRALEG